MYKYILSGMASGFLSATTEWFLLKPTEYYSHAYIPYILLLYLSIGLIFGLLWSILLKLFPLLGNKKPFYSNTFFIFILNLLIFIVALVDKKTSILRSFQGMNFLLFFLILFIICFIFSLIFYSAFRILLPASATKWISEIPGWTKIVFIFLIILTVFLYSMLPHYSMFKLFSSPGNPSKKASIILITIDTLRADYVSGYNSIDATPEIRKFSQDAVVFKNCFSSSPWTVPSHATLFTSLVPSSHGADWMDRGRESDSVCMPLAEKVKTITEILKDNNYATAAIVGNLNLSKAFGLNQGFQFYNDNPHPYFEGFKIRPAIIKLFYEHLSSKTLKKIIENLDIFFIKSVNFVYSEKFREYPLNYPNILLRTKKNADEVNYEAIQWINNNKKSPFFLFINYCDPHDPYIPQKGYLKKAIKNYAGKVDYMTYPLGYNCKFMSDPSVLSYSDLEYIKALYEGEVRFADFNLGLLFSELKKKDLFDNTLIIVTSDHGEALGEHNFLTHDNFLYDELLHVPFLVKFPEGKNAGMTDTRLTGLIDVMPSILKSAGIDKVKGMEGNSNMFDILVSDYEKERFIPSEVFKTKKFIKCDEKFNRDLKSMRSLNWKIIKGSNDSSELYNLDKDPFELKNVKNEKKEIFHYLSDRFEDFFSARRAIKELKISEGRKKELEDKLKALGYAQ